MPRGRDRIVACPKCKSFARHGPSASGDTVEVQVWTDGKQAGPMLPRRLAVAKCHRCSEVYWLADAEEIGNLGAPQGATREVDPAWNETGRVAEPTEEEYYEAIEKGLAANAEQERNLRILAWWKRNDAYRDKRPDDGEPEAAPAGAWRANLEALARLLVDGDENDRLIRAEVLREMGEFESAVETLGQVASPHLAPVVRQIRSLCVARDPRVRQLRFGA